MANNINELCYYSRNAITSGVFPIELNSGLPQGRIVCTLLNKFHNI